ncbi:Golgi autoantigen, golgin subfamily b, macrogolgin 1 [Apodemus speciosus]|uniref:Golgi autoantigen, golgin subfamily b, macrogolgin 1 n=1 Tax=Apodemus speciosus TaxID=105296 RepID=A0ABQ0FLX0_APOSI
MLKEIHQKEMRIQQLNSKFSQLLEEKSILSAQLSDASQSLREHQHHYSNLSNHCAVLEKQVQKLQATGRLNGDAAPGAPQKNDEINRRSEPETTGEEQPRQLCTSKQELNELQKLLEEERDREADR